MAVSPRVQKYRTSHTTPLPPGYYICLKPICRTIYTRYAVYIFGITFVCYTLYHASRKPISVVKSVLHVDSGVGRLPAEKGLQSWPPFDGENWSQLIGGLEYGYLAVYAVSMAISGYLAERIDIRYYLSAGMFLAGLTNIAFGMAYYLDIHSYYYFMSVQLLSGVVQSSGWPAVVMLMGNWWGKRRRGLVMGLWNAHTSLGNILGSLIAGHFVVTGWGASFCLPGLLLIAAAGVVFLTLIDRPSSGLGFNHWPSPANSTNGIGCGQQQLVESKANSMEAATNGEQRFSRCQSEPFLPELPTSSLETLLPPDEKSSSSSSPSSCRDNDRAISFCDAVCLPNVLAYSLLLFFSKLVSYTFLYWLPNYLTLVNQGQQDISADGRQETTMASAVSAEEAAKLSVIFDLGGILGGVIAGLISDSKETDSDHVSSGRRASTCATMLALAAPLLVTYRLLGSADSLSSLVVLFLCGATVNGPYALITTAVSADLGTQKAIQGRARALATIAAIVDSTGSFGAALGPLLTGLLVPLGWSSVFAMLITADLLALAIAVWISQAGQCRCSSLSPKKSSRYACPIVYRL